MNQLIDAILLVFVTFAVVAALKALEIFLCHGDYLRAGWAAGAVFASFYVGISISERLDSTR